MTTIEMQPCKMFALISTMKTFSMIGHGDTRVGLTCDHPELWRATSSL
jgi:hypothetical protein